MSGRIRVRNGLRERHGGGGKSNSQVYRRGSPIHFITQLRCSKVAEVVSRKNEAPCRGPSQSSVEGLTRGGSGRNRYT